MSAEVTKLTSFIFSIANLLRTLYRRPQYRRVMLPMTVLRRLDCIVEESKDKVLAELPKHAGKAPETVEKIILKKFDLPFVNSSKFTFRKLLDDPDHIAANFAAYIRGFSGNVQKLFVGFEFEKEIAKLDQANVLYKIVKAFATEVDLHPNRVPNIAMGYVFEELVREYNEQANEEAGDHFTPREVIRLMVHLLFQPDDRVFSAQGLVRTVYDPACGTGGMLSVAEEYVRERAPGLELHAFGQEVNDESYAICGFDLMLKGENPAKIAFGDTLGNGKTADGHKGETFHYMLSNPPFGVEWKVEEDIVRNEHEKFGFDGRFGPGLPRINDGSFLFLLHMLSKRKSAVEDGGEGSRIAIVFNGSPLFTGDAGSGESEIRRWIVENDWLEAIVALPDQLFYNTGIYTYIWIVTNRKSKKRQGKVQMIDGTGFFKKMKKSLGNKRNELSEAQIDELTRLYGDFKSDPHIRIFPNQEFGYIKLTVERPLRLNFRASPERLARVAEQGAFIKLAESAKRKDKKSIAAEVAEGKAQQKAILSALAMLPTGELWKDRSDFLLHLDNVLESLDFKVGAPLRKSILTALSERDETAEICYLNDDPDNGPEPDPELRDTENVTLPADFPLPAPIAYGPKSDNGELIEIVRAHCDAYFEREVKPHVSDAWIDYSKTKLGFEIPFNRYFYQYQPPRELAAIESDIESLEKDIVRMLAEITRK